MLDLMHEHVRHSLECAKGEHGVRVASPGLVAEEYRQMHRQDASVGQEHQGADVWGPAAISERMLGALLMPR